MEGLIKDLVGVALGHLKNEDEEDSRTNNRSDADSSTREDRTRSTWAEVVTGEDRQESEFADPSSYSSRPLHHRKEEADSRHEDWEGDGDRHPQRKHQHEEDFHRNDDSETGAPRRSQRMHQQEEDDRRNQEWESVGRRHPQKRHQQVPMEHWHGYKRPPSEQEYSTEVDFGADMEPTREEFADLSRACNRLWQLDLNRLEPGKDYEIDCAEGKKPYEKEDAAQGSLFNWVLDDVFRRPTYARFCSLLDNYNPNQGCKENVTPQERQEQAAFIEEISRTAPIKYLHKYLVYKGIAPEDSENFKRMMTNLWFELYGRGGSSNSSSAFEHVFVGEIKQHGNQEVSGFHNWIQFYMEETKGRVDYQGYIFPKRHGHLPDSETQLLTIQFEWNGVLKSVSSTLIGVSPEFEMALYTLCFYLGEEDNHIQLGPYPVNVKCYRMGRDKIGSVFPIAEA